MQRIMIFGIPGSGKSTFAMQLGDLLQLPVFHLDRHFYIENWIERNYDEFLQIQKSLVEKEAWIIDGNNSKSFEIRFSRADTILYFRFNRFLCLWRIFKRLFFKDQRISDRAEGCSETVRLSLIRYLWGYDKRVRHKIEDLRARYPQVVFHEIRNRNELKTILSRSFLL